MTGASASANAASHPSAATPSTRSDPGLTGQVLVRRPLVLGALVLFWLSATMGLRGLTQPDEGRYIGVAWEMLRSGDWVVPTLNGLPFFHKPPLFYWLSAGSLATFGLHDWAGRLPSLIGACGAAWLMYVFARRWSGLGTARATLLVLVTQPAFFIGAQFANLDMLVAGCMSMTILALAHAVMLFMQGARPLGDQGEALEAPVSLARRWLVGGWVAAAFGVLAKGLIGFVLPGLAVLGWLCLLRRPKLMAKLFWWPGPLLFLVIAGPWFVVMQMRFAEFFDYFVMEQHFRRFAGTYFNNVRPFWFYVPVLALITLPWSPWLVRAWRRPDGRSPPTGSPAQAARILMWTWAAVIVGFFSIPSSKLIGYVFAALPPLAWLIGDAANAGGLAARMSTLAPQDGASRRRPWARAWRASAVLAVVVCLVFVVAVARFQPPGVGAVATTLAAQRQPGQPILMVDNYVYDLGFEAPLREPVMVVDDWQNPELKRHDNWRKELLDAGRFAPDMAARVLIGKAQMNDAMCHADVSWLIGTRASTIAYPFLAGRMPVATSKDTLLWRIDRHEPRPVGAVDCATER